MSNEDKFWETVKQAAADPQPVPPMPEPTGPTLDQIEAGMGLTAFDPADYIPGDKS